MAFWNANGLKNKKLELLEFARHHDLDVILVNETHLRAADTCRLPNYTLYRTDRPDGRGGGTAIYAKTSMDHNALDAPDTANIEATAIRVQTARNGAIRLISVYKAPDRILMPRELDTLLEGNEAVVIAGDLNSKHPTWNSRTTTRNGRRLHDYAENHRDIIIDGPVDPTHYPGNGYRPDVLDIAILKDVTFQHQLTSLPELDSDHNPVLLHLGQLRNDHTETINSVSWPAFTDHLQDSMGRIDLIHTTEDLEDAVGRLTSRIQSSIRFATNTKPAPDRRDRLPDHIKDLIRTKNRARRLAQRTMNPAHRAENNRLAAEVRTAIAQHQNDTWETKLQALTTEDNSLWRMTKILRNKTIPTPPIHGANGMAYTDVEKAEAFAENLERQCSPNYANADVDHIGRIHRSVRRRLRQEDPQPLLPATPNEIQQLIRKTKPRKAPGPDTIGNRALKALPRKGLVALTAIINSMLRLHHFPSQWKCADVIVLPKPGQPNTFPQNYRPISLLPTMGKIAEGVILKRLKTDIDNTHAIQDEQFGFRSSHSTVHQILRVVENITEGFNKRQSTGAIFLDVSKAFDKVWHHGLLHKMMEANISLAMTQLIASFLARRTFRIKLNGTRSGQRSLTAGVPQGSLLSPALFSIFVRDLPNTPDTRTALYADDTAILASSLSPRLITRRLQTAAEALEEWFRTWRIEVNPEKSTAILFSKRRHQPYQDVDIFDRPIPWKTEAKYLGVTMDKSLTWGSHVTTCTNRAKLATSTLFSLLNRRSKLSAENKLIIYKSIIRPTMTYAATVWGYAANCHMKKLQTIQNKTLRLVFDAPWFVRNTQLHQDAQLPTIREFLQDSATKLYGTIQDHDNPLIRTLGDYNEDDFHRHKRPRMVLLPP